MLLSRLPPWSLLIAAIIPITAVLAFADGLPKEATLALTAVAVVWGAVMAVMHWKRLDEAAKAAHRWAWYWGSSLGLFAAIMFATLAYKWPTLLAAANPWVEAMTRHGQAPESAWIFLGVVLTGVAQGVGFIGAFVYWWTIKR